MTPSGLEDEVLICNLFFKAAEEVKKRLCSRIVTRAEDDNNISYLLATDKVGVNAGA